MFEGITKSLGDALKKLRGRGRLTAENVKDGLREVRRAFLEADVNFTVATDFIARVEAKSLGQDVLARVDPSEQIVKNVYEELVALMGPVDHKIPQRADRPVVLMLCGLQGAGKTTTAAKLALTLKGQNRKPMLAAADLQRPGAVEQLRTLGEQIGVPVYSEATNPVDVCRNAVAQAKKTLCDCVILDTAGRLQIDDALMDELKRIDKLVKPDECYLVVDAMIGQEAANVAKTFNDALELNACILTKLDGDARGGAALSIKGVTGVPIKFVGMGEKVDKLEDFVPERMAGRILGQGDMMGVVEKIASIQQQMSQEELAAQQEKIKKGEFTIDDFRKQFEQIAKMGMKDMISRMPGMSEMIPEGEDPEVALKRVQGMIDSMTKKERADPDIIDTPRRRRIAKGAGVEPHEVNQFLKQFGQVRVLMKQMASMSLWQRLKMVTGMGKMGAFLPGGMDQIKTKGDTGHRKSAKERAEDRKKKKKRK
ncbi:Signal recognition particle protein [Gemmata obscuriglobus]|uniref:Signal recognition particle protein n=2 Tax=Gemmata TaxID=113 RepID=A0A2Z3GTV8_9BACT|nr:MULTISPECIES: signal recognition particle protein [Gemmata]AWM37203.1 signal recognition particle protein [Gemmata obscuriglobus]MDY3560050.1 signal recognition particle protein [Gemmata algarum]QEG30057.1 Signal recognition particle protein [Gemmata obscuriglobus]VTS09378.1 signal recognition particle protein : Signal recognition particle protein OS=Isosphaera pallida (strain ATCC 43644 / DSM 9630 / IS1B) GN=ffh PE=3 SV=1: SRP54_N: SRP54: SRP_SPB [Gemmata obscuriglobus UQM 2246]